MAISRRLLRWATYGGFFWSAACGGQPAPTTTPAGVVGVTRTLPVNQVYVLEAWGAAPDDTTLMVSTALGRTVVLRHGPPDNTAFAEVMLPPAALPTDRDSVRVTLRPRPGLYGLDVETDAPLGPGARLTFRYPVHFAAPAGARDRYGSDAAFERALAIGRVIGDRITLLPSSFPASDNLSAALPGAGRYVVAAPR